MESGEAASCLAQSDGGQQKEEEEEAVKKTDEEKPSPQSTTTSTSLEAASMPVVEVFVQVQIARPGQTA